MTTEKVVNDILQTIEEASEKGEMNQLLYKQTVGVTEQIVRFIIGVFIVFIMITVPLVVILELCYINLPILREAIDKKVLVSNGKIQKAAKITLRDAMEAIRRADTYRTGKSATVEYIGIKFKWICLIMFIITLILGGGSVIIKILITLISGVLEAIGNALSML